MGRMTHLSVGGGGVGENWAGVDYLSLDNPHIHARINSQLYWESLSLQACVCCGTLPGVPMNNLYLHVCASVLYIIVVCHKFSIYSCRPCPGGIRHNRMEA